MEMKKLTQLGMTSQESLIYGTVLKLGMCTVKEISKECGYHRTNIYDVLEKLKERGLIVYYQEGNVSKYRVTSPDNFYSILYEQKEILDSIVPEMKQIYAQTREGVIVELYKGEEGMKSVFRDMIREGQKIYGFGIHGQLREKMPGFADQILNELKKKKMKTYLIFTEKGNLPKYYTQVRYVPNKLSGPVATFIYGDKININIWEPSLVAIIIKSKLVSQMYKKHFDLLWKIAEK